MCHDLPMKDGLSSVAWSKLMQRHSLEKEDKVLEAYKISQVSTCTCIHVTTKLRSMTFSVDSIIIVSST